MMEILYKQHGKWLNMLAVLGCPIDDREDLVQDMYIKIVNQQNPSRIMYNETEVNRFYIYLVLRSIYYDFIKMRSRNPLLLDHDINDEHFIVNDEYSIMMDDQHGWERMYSKLLNGVNGLGMYGSKLTQAYFKTDKSMRDMAEETTISLTSIFNSIRKYRAILKEEFGEDWEDYINGDYDKI